MSQWLPYLLILVCPLTMGVMMWLMMRGTNQRGRPQARVAELESQVDELRAALEKREDTATKRTSAANVTADRT